MKKVRIEIVKTRAGKIYTAGGMMGQIQYHGRVIGKNGKKVWVTETMKSRANVLKAIRVIASISFSQLYPRDVDETGD